jgi:hypothetical protein
MRFNNFAAFFDVGVRLATAGQSGAGRKLEQFIPDKFRAAFGL